MTTQKIAERWARLVVTAINNALDSNKTHIDLAGHFSCTYEILTWPELLDKCLQIFEDAELYEHCARVVATKEKTDKRVATFRAHLNADTIRG